jgi:hypothetical protein
LSVGHSTHHRKVIKTEFPLPDVKQKLAEVSLDGGKVRLRGSQGEGSYWKEYKTARLQGIYYGAFLKDNLSLTDWINSQQLTNPLYCLGDGHEGIWNIFADVGEKGQRQEILDWYHLKENLYKVTASEPDLKQLEAYLWLGQVSEALTCLRQLNPKGGSNFCDYLSKHRHRIINYQYFQSQQICSIGSGAVESAVKQISARLKLTGAQWKEDYVPRMLQLRCAYLNEQLAI